MYGLLEKSVKIDFCSKGCLRERGEDCDEIVE